MNENLIYSSVEKTTDGLIVSKVLSMLILAICSAVAGFIPTVTSIYHHRRTPSSSSSSSDRTSNVTKLDKILSCGMCFGGGVLLCTVFLHLLPEVQESAKELRDRGVVGEFALPHAELLMCVGFFLIFGIEELAKICANRSRENHKIGVENPTFAAEIESGVDLEEKRINAAVTKKYCSFGDDTLVSDHRQSDHHDHINGEILSELSIRNFLIVLSLSVHETFEGLAIGLEKTAESTWTITMAVACHKVVLAACVGVQMTTSQKPNWTTYWYIVMFAITSPVGIGIGLLLDLSSDDVGGGNIWLNILSVTLQGLATGTLLYIIFFEILKEHHDHYRVEGASKFAIMLFGFLFMTCVQTFV